MSNQSEPSLEYLIKLVSSVSVDSAVKNEVALKIGHKFLDVANLYQLIAINEIKASKENSQKIVQFFFTLPIEEAKTCIGLWETATRYGHITEDIYSKVKCSEQHAKLFPLRSCYLHHTVNFKTCKSHGMVVSTEPEGCVTPWVSDDNANIICVHTASSYSLDAARDVMRRYLLKHI